MSSEVFRLSIDIIMDESSSLLGKNTRKASRQDYGSLNHAKDGAFHQCDTHDGVDYESQLQGVDANRRNGQSVDSATATNEYRSDRDSTVYSSRQGKTSCLRARLQIPLLCYIRIMEPISFYSVFPYIAEMTQHNGNLANADVGFYTGVFESLFSAVQALVLIFWGSTADRLGYKHVLLFSLSGMAITPLLFGLSTSLWQMAAFRCLNGAFAGSNVILRSMLMHNCTLETQVQAFSWYTFADNFAYFIGPLIGGALANPAAQYPGAFKGLSFFEEHPYALPSLVTGAICASGILLVVLMVDDTGKHVSRQDAHATTPGSHPSLRSLVNAPGVFSILCTLMSGRVLGASMVAVSTTALPSSVSEGGMSYTSRGIAWLIATQGAVEAVWLLGAFPFLHRKARTKGTLHSCTTMFMIAFASYACMSISLRYGGEKGQTWHWVALSGVLICGSGVLMAGTSSQIAVQNLTPDSRALGTLNAIAETSMSIVKTVTPAAATALFAVGVRSQLLEGYLVWVVLICISPGLSISAMLLPNWVDGSRVD